MVIGVCLNLNLILIGHLRLEEWLPPVNLPAISCTLSQRSRLLLQAGCTISGRTHTVVFEHTPLPVLIAVAIIT